MIASDTRPPAIRTTLTASSIVIFHSCSDTCLLATLLPRPAFTYLYNRGRKIVERNLFCWEVHSLDDNLERNGDRRPALRCGFI